MPRRRAIRCRVGRREKRHKGWRSSTGFSRCCSGAWSRCRWNCSTAGPLRFLEVTVGGETLVPRRRITSVAYALRAGANNIDLSNSLAGSGLITKDGVRFIHNFGSANTFLGVEAGNFTMIGGGNIATGHSALFSNDTGFSNTATGANALRANTSGIENTATGTSALFSNDTGRNNTATGRSALFSNTTGSFNTATGRDELRNNDTGNSNTATGREALRDNIDGAFNIATGTSALRQNINGGNNTATGVDALRNNTTGSNNTAVGFGAGVAHETGDNNIYVNHAGGATESNTTRIGTQGTQAATFIAGISGATSAGGVAVFVNNSGQLGTMMSSKRFKQQVRDMGEASTVLLRLRPVTFRYTSEYDDGAGLRQYGLVAEEVAEVFPDLVQYAETGEAYAVRYHFVNAMLLNEVQKQHHQITAQDHQIVALTARLAATGSGGGAATSGALRAPEYNARSSQHSAISCQLSEADA